MVVGDAAGSLGEDGADRLKPVPQGLGTLFIYSAIQEGKFEKTRDE